MIEVQKGNLLESSAQALVNSVNLVGVMGKGIALQFKKKFPENYKKYVEACQNKTIDIGKPLVTKEKELCEEKLIINLPTKTHWNLPSRYEYIEKGLDALVEIIQNYQIKSIAIPPLGVGNGGLLWADVKKIIIQKLHHLKDVQIILYEPSDEIREKLLQEKVKLTPARALMLYVLYDLVAYGEYVSEFSAEKICYFLQRLGAEKYFNLKFTPNFYGPYSGKVRYVINYLNGSYILGYDNMNKKPFEPLLLVQNGYEEVKSFIETQQDLFKVASCTINLLRGFYSDFALELLSTVDWIMLHQKVQETLEVRKALSSWNVRKKSNFSDEKHIETAILHLKEYFTYS